MSESYIEITGHGLSAGDEIALYNIEGALDADGWEAILEGVKYYVLASGLTADAFQISLTDGGAAVTWEEPITAGSIQPWPTYSLANDGVLDPPTTPPTATAPNVSSTTISGIVRLTIELADTPEEKVRTWEVQSTHRYITNDPPGPDEGDPDWTYAQVFNLPEGTSELTVPALPSTPYTIRVRAIDVFGNEGAWSTEVEVTTVAGADALIAALADLANDVSDGSITETKIADGSISTPKLQARAVTADVLAATIVLSSLIYGGDPDSRHVELDEFGVRLVDADGTLVVNIPTDSSQPVYFRGQVVAESFSSTEQNDLSGEVALSGDGILTLANGVSTPTTAPTLSQGMGSVSLSTTPTGVSTAAGIWYDPTTTSYWIAADPDSGYIAHEYDSDGTWLRSIEATGSTTTVTDTVGSTSHVSDGAIGYASSTTDNQVSSPITMPRDGRITKISVYCAGRLGSVQLRNAVWSNGGTLLRQSAWYTASSGGATAAGASDKYNISVSPLTVSGGTTYRVGFFKADGDSDGVQFDYDSGSSKTLYIGDNGQGDYSGGVTYTDKKLNVYVTYEYDVDTRLETLPNIGVATNATHLFLLDTGGTLWKYLLADGSYVGLADLSADITGALDQAGLFYDATSGNLVVTTTTGTGAGVYPKVIRVNPATLAVGTIYTAATGPTFTGSTANMRGGLRLADSLNGNAATYWLLTNSGVVYAYTFSGTTLTNTANRHFGYSAYSGHGIAHDGSNFHGWSRSSPTRFISFTNWDFTTTSTKLWVGYSWYDSAGTTHETAMGPRSSVTIRRRERVIVQTPTIPTGGADDPDNVRIYMLQNATDTGAGTFWLQQTHGGTSYTVESYTGSGTHDGAGTAFAAGSPAELRSSVATGSGGWSLKGSGAYIPPSGTAFPSSPSTNQHFFRTDLGLMFYYTGSAWHSTQLFTAQLRESTGASHVISSTTAKHLQAGVPSLQGGSDLYIVRHVARFIIGSGTALSGSHKWVGTFGKNEDSGDTTISTITIDSGSSSAWRVIETSVGADLGGSTFMRLWTTWTKTGTPGSLTIQEEITYRIVAT